MDYPKYAPDYARIEFNRLIDVWRDDNRRFQALNQWRNDSRMKFVYESLENSTKADNGYFILAMLDSYEIDLEKFKREDALTSKLDDDIANALTTLESLLSKRISLNDYAPDHYYRLKNYIGGLDLNDKPEVFTPNMVKKANATRQTKSPTGGINKAQYARAFIVNLLDNGFDVAAIKTAIAEALNVIFNDANNPFSINDIENCIKDLRKKSTR